jgi:spore germination protein GerM
MKVKKMKENKRIKTYAKKSTGDALNTLLGIRPKSEKELAKLQNGVKLAEYAKNEKDLKRILLEAEAKKGQIIELINVLQKY